MLVLSRKASETIIIGESVEIKVLQVRNGTVKLGIEAPKEMPLWRGEIAEQRRKDVP